VSVFVRKRNEDDGRPFSVLPWPRGDGTTELYVNSEPGYDKGTDTYHRGGPFHPRHQHRFEDYGLVGAVRCKKCGLVKEVET
jgi:hypothetical protein